jgi:predicted molibdopterin-dependent oxidoreductase YjgC
LLVHTDKNPNSTGARLLGLAAEPPGSNLAAFAERIRAGSLTTLIVLGEDVTLYGLDAETLAKLETLVVVDILPNRAAEAAHYVLPGCAHAEKRGSFTNVKGRVQRFMKAVEPPGNARPEVEFLGELWQRLTGGGEPPNLERLFNDMASNVPAFDGVAWAQLGDHGVTVPV